MYICFLPSSLLLADIHTTDKQSTQPHALSVGLPVCLICLLYNLGRQAITAWCFSVGLLNSGLARPWRALSEGMVGGGCLTALAEARQPGPGRPPSHTLPIPAVVCRRRLRRIECGGGKGKEGEGARGRGGERMRRWGAEGEEVRGDAERPRWSARLHDVGIKLERSADVDS